jgi:hypothetical protein
VVPVEHEPGATQLSPEILDVPRDELQRMDVELQGIILGVDAERVEADRLEHGVPLKALESSMDVVPREREEVADVQPLR